MEALVLHHRQPLALGGCLSLFLEELFENQCFNFIVVHFHDDLDCDLSLVDHVVPEAHLHVTGKVNHSRRACAQLLSEVVAACIQVGEWNITI